MNLVPAFSTAHGTALFGDELFAHFDQRAPRYQKQCEIAHWDAAHHTVHILNKFTNLARPGLRVLDLGTATGQQVRAIREINPNSHVIALDGSPEMIKLARLEQFNGRPLIEQGVVGNLENAAALNLRQYEADIVTLTGVLDFIRNTPELTLEMLKALADDGDRFFAATYQAFGEPNGNKDSLEHDTEALENLFRQNGASIVHNERFLAWESKNKGIQVYNNLLVGHLDRAIA